MLITFPSLLCLLPAKELRLRSIPRRWNIVIFTERKMKPKDAEGIISSRTIKSDNVLLAQMNDGLANNQSRVSDSTVYGLQKACN